MKSSFDRTLPLAPRRIAEASRSKSAPLVVRGSQPSPTIARLSPGSALVRERLLPLESDRLAMTCSFRGGTVPEASEASEGLSSGNDEVQHGTTGRPVADGRELPTGPLARHLGHDHRGVRA